MKPKQETMTVKDILDLYEQKILQPNYEYQRGPVWSKQQQQRLIDSVLRGYPLPLIYLHHKRNEVAGLTQDVLHIIDGQQRIRALHEFSKGEFSLLDPADDNALFPKFLKKEPCAWAKKRYKDLSDANLEWVRHKFETTMLSIVKMEDANDHEVRDLFIRLQAGAALNPQEKRDATVGNFATLVLELGGKREMGPGYHGHGFFNSPIMKSGQSRGKMRQLVAQILMLYLKRKENHSVDAFVTIKSQALDDFYYRQIDLNPNSPDLQRFEKILDKLASLFSSGKRPSLKGHDAIHLVLFVDSLWDNYTPKWQDRIVQAFDEFAKNIVKVQKAKYMGDLDFVSYATKIRTGADTPEAIRERHGVYVRKMREFLGDALVPKDAQRSFLPLDREVIYWRDIRLCWHCLASVDWKDAEFHHVIPYAKGGKTEIDNGALVHKDCHRSLKTSDVDRLRENFEKYKGDMFQFYIHSEDSE